MASFTSIEAAWTNKSAPRLLESFIFIPKSNLMHAINVRKIPDIKIVFLLIRGSSAMGNW